MNQNKNNELNYDPIDVQILIQDYIRGLDGTSHTIHFADLANNLGISVVTKEQFKAAAIEEGYVIEKEGGSLIMIKKVQPPPVFEVL